MDTWSSLCRCCLSPDSEISLFDSESNVKEKFFEVTSLEVTDNDGLPQKLCTDCCTAMNSAYQFRKQCIKMDNDLKIQLEACLKQTEEEMKDIENLGKKCNEEKYKVNDIANNPIKQLEAIIKSEPIDSDDDYYYVLVIDDPKNETNNNDNIKQEIIEENTAKDEGNQIEETDNAQTNFENSIDSFLVSDKVPANVPATILENEEESQGTEESNAQMDECENQDNPQDNDIQQVENVQSNNIEGIVGTITEDIQNIESSNNSYIKILTTTNPDGTITLKSADEVTYLTNTQLVDENNEVQEDQGEVIFCEGDESSQFQLLKYDGSELVIEYADDGQIATVLQQEDGTFLCNCGKQFEDLADYQNHQYTHHSGHDCTLCGKSFESAEILTGHMLLHNVTGLFIKCPFCNQLVKRNSLTQHIKYGHNNVRPRCNVCYKTFANPNNLKRHMMIHSGIRQFECDICFKRFHQKITMQTHRLIHIDPFACNACDKTFESKDMLASHKLISECSKSKLLKVKEELMKSVKQEITTNLGKLLGYACSLCKKMFAVESALEQHVEGAHMGDPGELLCSECGEVIPSKKDMQSHILSHKTMKNKNIKRYECSICKKGCPSQAMLIMHERVHTNERPYPCHLCALRFKTKTHLRTHQLTHTREKKFGCSICMKFFALKGNLVVHLRTHTGERPYVCSICSEAFIDSKYLKKHKLKKHAIHNSVPWHKF